MPLLPERRETIVTAATALARGEITCKGLLDTCLARIDAWEGQIHAWVSVDREGARRAARECDRELTRRRSEGSVASLSPLFGIPIGIKDIIDIASQPTGAGSELRSSGPPAERDATVVRKLREGGAIILGKTVTTQFACFDPPPTCNPWNLNRTPGGSSSGSAAAVAAGMCLGAIGSQTGGSIIRPASFCGVAGCKPTFSRVSCDGFVPVAPSLDTAGPFAGCVADLAIMLNAIASDHKVAGGDDPNLKLAIDPSELESENLRPPHLAVLDDFSERSDEAMRLALRRTVSQLRIAGASVESRSVQIDWLDAHRAISAYEFAAWQRERFAEVRTDYQPTVARLIQEGLMIPEQLYEWAKRQQAEAVSESVALTRDVDALVCPAARGPAPDPSTTGDPSFQSLWTYTGQPTITFPIGLSPDGLPLGIQLIGRRFDEAGLFRAAAWCEGVLPGLSQSHTSEEPAG